MTANMRRGTFRVTTAIVITSILFLSTFAFTLLITAPKAYADLNIPGEQIVVDGVLYTDKYVLYPFEKESISIGFSKYGEPIAYDEDAGIGVGIQFPGYDEVGTYDQRADTSRDPFANEHISVDRWIGGWLINISYIHRWLEPKDRRVWAFALFADGFGHGGDWITFATDPRAAPHGGRKTNKIAYTEPLQILYDGPRRFVARSVTHIYDAEGEATWPVVDVIITLIFNKVKKYWIMIKDIKLTIDHKDLEGLMDIEFSNREEWDLGPKPTFASYAHFFHQYYPTCYGGDWLLTDVILRKYWDKFIYPAGFEDTDYDDYEEIVLTCPQETEMPVAELSEKVYLNGALLTRGTDYDIDYDTGRIEFYVALEENDVIEVEYKNIMKYLRDPETGEDTDESHYIDVAQIISSDFKYVGFAAFWPTTSDYTVDGWADWYHSLTCVPTNFSDDVDMVSEPDIPFVIGEWDFELGYEPISLKQFRAVEVKGVVAYHDANDVDAGFDINELDREVKFLLDEVFNPWDLEDALHKKYKRWVYKTHIITPTTSIDFSISGKGRLVAPSSWDMYCVFSEKVLVKLPGWPNYRLLTPQRAIVAGYPGTWLSYPYTYDITYDSTTKEVTVNFYVDVDGDPRTVDLASWELPSSTRIKILYSTDPRDEKSTGPLWEVYTGDWDFTPNCTIMGAETILLEWKDEFGIWHTVHMYLQLRVCNETSGAIDIDTDWYNATMELDLGGFFKVPEEGWAYTSASNDTLKVFEKKGEYNVTIGPVTLDYWAYGEDIKEPIRVYIWTKLIELDVKVNGSIGPGTSNMLTVRVNATVEWIHCGSWLEGRYEWVVVGRTPPARTIDAAGAAMVAAVFKDKEIEIGLSGEDIEDGPYVPYVMAKMRTGTDWPAYFYDTGDKRTALRDDWCTTWPIASSNIIGVGGPGSNLLVYYFNEFTDAFWGVPEFSIAGWKDKIVALSCWSLKTYEDTEDTGYAVIATYKDLNGTVGLVIWGLRGRDTFYASKWFKEEGAYQIQDFPDCVTAIVLKIDYTKHEPSVSVVECLGTISETLVHGIKGGIHEDP